MSNSPGLVGFAVGLVDFTLSLPDRQVKVLGKTILKKFGLRKAIKLNFFAPRVQKSPTGEWLIEFTCTFLV